MDCGVTNPVHFPQRCDGGLIKEAASREFDCDICTRPRAIRGGNCEESCKPIQFLVKGVANREKPSALLRGRGDFLRSGLCLLQFTAKPPSKFFQLSVSQQAAEIKRGIDFRSNDIGIVNVVPNRPDLFTNLLPQGVNFPVEAHTENTNLSE